MVAGPPTRAERVPRSPPPWRAGLALALPLPPTAAPSHPPASSMPDAWVNRTYFPFFSDVVGHHSTGLRVVESAVLACIFLMALAGNVWGICLLVRRRHRLCAANCLVLNLFCADLLFISAMPIIGVVRWTGGWVLGPAVCHLLFYMVSLSGTVVILSLGAVSLERVVSIARLRRRTVCHRRALAATLLLIWGFSALATLPLCLFFTVVPLATGGSKKVQICTLLWPSIEGEIVWDVAFAIVVFLTPGLIVVISYSKILQITKASRKSLNAGLAYSENHHIRVSQQDYKLFRALFVLMISFFIMWSPIIITIFLILVQNFKQDLYILPSAFFWIMVFTFANSAVNPILYNVTDFRRKCQEILLCCIRRPTRNGAGTETTVRRNNCEQPNLSFIYR